MALSEHIAPPNRLSVFSPYSCVQEWGGIKFPPLLNTPHPIRCHPEKLKVGGFLEFPTCSNLFQHVPTLLFKGRKCKWSKSAGNNSSDRFATAWQCNSLGPCEWMRRPAARRRLPVGGRKIPAWPPRKSGTLVAKVQFPGYYWDRYQRKETKSQDFMAAPAKASRRNLSLAWTKTFKDNNEKLLRIVES